MRKEFTPKLFTLLRQGISRQQLGKDIVSGVIVGIVALPLAIAFAIASGVSPEKGLITAVVAGLIISAFGGSRVQIGGPTGAFIVIVYGIVQEHGLEGLTVATFLAGILIIIMGITRMGNLLKFIPYPLIVGFTSGIALIIFSSQVKDLLGLDTGALPAEFIGKWEVILTHLDHINYYAASIAAATLVIIIGFHKVTSKVPGSIVAIVLMTVVVQVFHLPVPTIESSFGSIPNTIGLPQIDLPPLETIEKLIQPAIAIALLGAIESLLSAVVSDGMIGARHRSNMELIAQGGANVASALFGGIPATGAIARTATNVKNGGRTPIAGIVHALVLLMIIFLFAGYVKHIPMACLAGILVVVSYNMSEWRQFRSLVKGNYTDVIILLSTFLLTVVFDLVIAIEVGIVLSSFFFMKRMSESLEVRPVNHSDEDGDPEVLFEEEIAKIPEGVALYEISGPLFFGAARQFQDVLSSTHSTPKIIILRMRHVPFVDGTGMQRLKEIIKQFRHQETTLIISGAKESVLRAFEQYRLEDVLSRDHIQPSVEEALHMARRIMEKARDTRI